MILGVGLRTDIVRYYTEWLLNRFRDGVVLARNPLFPGKLTEYRLSPDKLDGIYFCSKDYTPLLPHLGEFVPKYNTLFHLTLNGYGTETEPDLAPLETRIEDFRTLSQAVGKNRLFWRYDPILITKTYSLAWHMEMFERLASELSPHTAGCIVNFPEFNFSLNRRACGNQMFTRDQREEILCRLGPIGMKYTLPLRLCGRGVDYGKYGFSRSGCVTLSDFAAANGCRFQNIRHAGNRRDCACIVIRDIGWYDSCPGKCVYCNADRDFSLVDENCAAHDPTSPLLIGRPHEGDLIQKSPQESFLAPHGQISLFDD